jgi:hypothetical protein
MVALPFVVTQFTMMITSLGILRQITLQTQQTGCKFKHKLAMQRDSELPAASARV